MSRRSATVAATACTTPPVIGKERRQVFDLPAIELTVIEHQAQRRVCGCGVVTTVVFPAQASAPT